MEKIYCPDCGTELNVTDTQCPQCGSMNRTMEVSDSSVVYESLVGIIDKQLYSGEKKFFSELRIKPDFDRDTQQDVMVSRKYNRLEERQGELGTYIEEIRGKNGKFIKITYGILNKHIGHGNDRKDRRQQDVIVTQKYNRLEECQGEPGTYIEETRDKDGKLIKITFGILNECIGYDNDRKNRKQPVDGGDADA